jgi:hypothetical protein
MLVSREGRFVPEGCNTRDGTRQETERTSELVPWRRRAKPVRPPPESNPYCMVMEFKVYLVHLLNYLALEKEQG